MDIVKYLKVFSEKRGPKEGGISLQYEDAIKYDIYSVYIKDGDGQEYLFDSFEDGVIKARRWDCERNVYSIDSTLDPASLTPDSFSGTYFYHAWQYNFTSLHELKLCDIYKFRFRARWGNIKFSREKYFYRQRKQDISDVMGVLAALLRLYRSKEDAQLFSEFSIMTEVAGRLWIYHDDRDRMEKDLRLSLESLVANGDVIKIESRYKPTGKALNTLANANRDNERYAETASIQKKMLLATFLSAFGAVMSAYAAYKGMK